MFPIISHPLGNGWKVSLCEAVLPGNPRYWVLDKQGLEPFQFPIGESYPGDVLCNAIISYAEELYSKFKA